LRAFRDPTSHGVSCRKLACLQTIKAMRVRITLRKRFAQNTLRLYSASSAGAGVWECDASSHRFLLQERTLVSLVQFIFNTAA